MSNIKVEIITDTLARIYSDSTGPYREVAMAYHFPETAGSTHRPGWYVNIGASAVDNVDLRMYADIADRLNAEGKGFTFDRDAKEPTDSKPEPKRRGRPRKTESTEEQKDA